MMSQPADSAAARGRRTASPIAPAPRDLFNITAFLLRPLYASGAGSVPTGPGPARPNGHRRYNLAAPSAHIESRGPMSDQKYRQRGYQDDSRPARPEQRPLEKK